MTLARILLLGTLVIAATAVIHAESVGSRLDGVASGLDQIADELESQRKQTLVLRAELARWAELAQEHESSLREQSKLLSEYEATVRELEEHDRRSLSLAESVQRQLVLERSGTTWLWAITGAAVLVAVAETAVWLTWH